MAKAVSIDHHPGRSVAEASVNERLKFLQRVYGWMTAALVVAGIGALLSIELGLVQACAELGTAFVAFSPVGRGFLTDAPIPLKRARKLAFTSVNPRFIEPNYSANIAATDRFRRLAAEMGAPAAAVAIAWTLAQGDHVLPIPGTRSVAHFRELVRGTELTLTASDLAAIEAALPVGWAHGDRYDAPQWVGPERYC